MGWVLHYVSQLQRRSERLPLDAQLGCEVDQAEFVCREQ